MLKKTLLTALVIFAVALTFTIFAMLLSVEGHGPSVAFIYTAIFFLPSLVAKMKKHHNVLPVFLVNWLLGWTVVGWVIALVWPLLRKAPEVKAA